VGPRACSTRVWLEGASRLCTRTWTACQGAQLPLLSRGAYPVKSMLITAICGAPSLLTELGYSFSPILPLNCFLVKLYIGAYGLYCLLLLACGGPGKGESQTFLEAASCEGFELPGR